MQVLNSFKTSPEKALDEIDKNWRDYPGLLVCGTHAPNKEEFEKIIRKINQARMTGYPFLGICSGMQLAVIEIARNRLGIKDATTEELESSPNAVIVKMPELRVGIKFTSWWGGDGYESHWHNYKVSNQIILPFPTWVSGNVLEAFRIENHPFFAGVQFHPEYQSSKKDPHPVLVEFIEACKEYAKNYN